MVTITTRRPDYSGYKDTEFSDVFEARKFIFKMIKEGYLVTDYVCNDSEEIEVIEEAIKAAKKGRR